MSAVFTEWKVFSQRKKKKENRTYFEAILKGIQNEKAVQFFNICNSNI